MLHSVRNELPLIERIEGGLDVREWLFRQDGRGGRAHRLLVLEAGSVEVAWDTARQQLDGPLMVWAPDGASLVIRVAAGSRGALAALPDDRMAAAVAASSSNIVDLVQRSLAMPVSERRDMALALQCIAVLDEETKNLDAMTDAVVAAQLACLAALVWRVVQRSGSMVTRGGTDIAVLRRFRNLVELHFREQKPVGFYAAQLGVSTDRLHALTRRALGLAPLQLINDRLAEEAMRELQTGHLSIAQIAHRLGFASRSYFGRFFAERTGKTPRRYRLDWQSPERTRFDKGSWTFSDWP